VRRHEQAGRQRTGRQVVALHRRALTRQHEINQSLRRTILPDADRHSDVNGMRVAIRYRAADQTAGIGGDWYLADPLPGGGLLLAVGDVAGHGLPSAGTMVQLRHSAFALAVAGHDPATILSVLNHLLCQQPTVTMATAVLAVYQPRTRELTWARAGHLPILAASRHGVESLWQPAGLILGARAEAEYVNGVRRLGEYELLVMYTDGYVEAPGQQIDDGLRQLERDTSLAMRGSPSEWPTAVVEQLPRRNPNDDACILAATTLHQPTHPGMGGR
jgi:serine phosphatase RsbU (regulator of sigma subunit)